MSIEDFYKKYTTVIREDGTDIFETFGEDLDYVKQFVKENKVWSAFDNYGKLAFVSGLYRIDTLYYIITNEPYESEFEYYYSL